jgi:hypothetical protein
MFSHSNHQKNMSPDLKQMAIKTSSLQHIDPDNATIPSTMIAATKSVDFCPRTPVRTKSSDLLDMALSSPASTPGRTKSASGRLQTIREKKFKLTSPVMSPSILFFGRDVFGESLNSLDAWGEEDKFDAGSPIKRHVGQKSPRAQSGSRSSRLKELNEKCDAFNLDFFIFD